MISSLVTSWQIEGEKVKVVTDFLLGFGVTVNGDYSHGIRTQLLLRRKVLTNLDSISKAKPSLCQQKSV